MQIAPEDPDEDNRPMYVNAKQYHRILKRRAARAKLEQCGKVIRKRKVSDGQSLFSAFHCLVMVL